MKLLFDTNVLISAIVSRGYSYDVVADAIDKHEIIITEQVLRELAEVLSRKFDFSPELTASAKRLFQKHCVLVGAANKAPDVCRDAADNQLLADAAANKVDALISGDADLLVLKEYQGMRILSPKAYWKL